MPYFDSQSGFQLYNGELCDRCSHFPCQVFTDLALEGKQSKWHEKHIVEVGHKEHRNEIECQGYSPYVAPQDRPDPDPGFGLRISQQEANRLDGLPEETPRPDVR